jgi:hypothetical protein
MKSLLPTKLIDWERKLTEYFLAVEADGNASDIRSFEVTSETLALAAGVEEGEADLASSSFREALVQDPGLFDALKHGYFGASTDDYSGYFAYLCLTLLVDTLSEQDYATEGEFRARLGMWLGIDHGFQQLSGVAKMWRRLEMWLRTRALSGAPFKQLVLPKIPSTWTHIGYTRRLAFPSRADVRFFERFSQSNAEALRDPLKVIHLFAPLTLELRCSSALRDAFDDFRNAYLRRERALADHRFWRLVQKASAGHSAKRPDVEIELVFNEDREMEFITYSDASSERTVSASLGAAIKASRVERSENLGSAIDRGVLYFKQIATARWAGDAELTSTPSGLFVALSRELLNKMGSSLGDFVESGGWWVTKSPLMAGKIERALSLHGYLESAAKIFRASVVDGIRVKSAWLGLPSFLPRLNADTPDVEARHVSAEEAVQNLHISDGRFESSESVDGSYVVQPVGRDAEHRPSWSLRVQFTRSATPHAELSGARYALPQLSDWNCFGDGHRLSTDTPLIEEDRDTTESDELLEALYADGQYGWEEADLIKLIRRVDARSPWEILRCLHDAGLVSPRLRRGWRGRVWTLTEPTLVRAFTEIPTVILEGALCVRLIEDFRVVVGALGGRFFKRPGIGRWPILTIGAVEVDAAAVAKRLGWTFEEAPKSPGATPCALMTTTRLGQNYQRASSWDWEAGGFRQSYAHGQRPDLARYVHPDGRDHDLYRLEWRGETHVFLSRTASIAAAYVAARRPMFVYRDDALFRLTREGGLPDSLAAALRRRTLKTAGLVDDIYVYPASEQDAGWVAKLLPHFVEVETARNPDSVASVLTKVRNSGGRLRPKWIGGKLTV